MATTYGEGGTVVVHEGDVPPAVESAPVPDMTVQPKPPKATPAVKAAKAQQRARLATKTTPVTSVRKRIVGKHRK